MTDKQLIDLGRLVAEEAEDIFEQCGAADDFCIQHVGVANAVFGGTNRLLWSPGKGFRVDKAYCTDNFLSKWSLR